jgi:transposase-like protein
MRWLSILGLETSQPKHTPEIVVQPRRVRCEHRLHRTNRNYFSSSYSRYSMQTVRRLPRALVRSVKFRLGPMLGLKHFRRAATTIAGIELMHRIRKGQFKLGRLGAKGNTAPKIWNAVLAA